jgi:hypothetical protein
MLIISETLDYYQNHKIKIKILTFKKILKKYYSNIFLIDLDGSNNTIVINVNAT